MAYQERLKTLNAADFGDLLLENIRLFRQNADVLRSFQERFKFILVDEYQDTNVAQYLWLRLLAQTTPVASHGVQLTLPGKARAKRRSPNEGQYPPTSGLSPAEWPACRTRPESATSQRKTQKHLLRRR